jgi:hypothetical protein
VRLNNIFQTERSMKSFAKITRIGTLIGILASMSWPDGAHGAEVAADSRPIYPLAVQGPKPAAISPPSASDVHDSILRGIQFLIATQRKDGAWGSAESKKSWEIFAPLSGSHHAFRTAVTALSTMALIESANQFGGHRRETIESAIERGQQWLLQKSSDLRRVAPDAYSQLGAEKALTLYNVWGHAYAIHAIVRLHQRAQDDPSLQDKLKNLLDYHVDRLRRDAFIDGGWGYYDMGARTHKPSGSSISFTTATVLIALKEAEQLGVKFPEALLEKARESIVRQRYPDFAYAYGEYLADYPRMPINRPSGSLGRSQACNLALRVWGDQQVTDEVLRTWLDRLFARNGWLSMSRKRFIAGESPHATYVGVAGYFYYYGHYYASLCIEQLPEDERAVFQGHLAHILLPLQEKDGSWWDFPLYSYHQQYGTAMAVCSLTRGQLSNSTADGE